MGWTRTSWLGGVSLGLVACNLLLGNELGSGVGIVDDTDAPAAHEEPDARDDAAPDAPPGLSCPTIHVAPGGSDDNDGCFADRPLKTVQGALDSARLHGGQALHLCAGTYRETIAIEQPISLVGGFDCATFEANPKLTTTLHGVDAQHPTLTLRGAAVDRSVSVSRLRVEGPDAESPLVVSESLAIRVEDGARPVLSHLEVQAGIASGRAVGVEILGSDPVLEHSVIHSGQSACASFDENKGGVSANQQYGATGNIGVYVEMGTAGAATVPGPSLRYNTVEGGYGAVCTNDSAHTSSIGVLLVGGRYVGDNAFANNTVAAYQEVTDGAGPDIAVALASFGATLEVTESHLHYGSPVESDASVASLDGLRGRETLLVHGKSSFWLRRSRVAGPAVRSIAFTGANRARTVAVHAQGFEEVEISDSLLLGSVAPAGAMTTDVRALRVEAATVRVRHSTLVFGLGAPRINYGITTYRRNSTVELSHNLLLSGDPERGTALWAAQENVAWALHGNVFGDVSTLLFRGSTPTNSDNVVVVATPSECPSGADCVSLCAGVACVPRILEVPVLPEEEVFQVLAERMPLNNPQGWRLSADLPCTLARRPGGDLGGVDLLGVPRAGADGRASPGAHEQLMCVNP